MAETNILQKAAAALVSYITTGLADATVVLNLKASAEKDDTEFVGCSAEESTGEDIGTGNSAVELIVKVKYRAAVDTDGIDPKAGSDTLTARVGELLAANNLADQLNAAGTNFTVFGFFEDPRFSIEQDGDFWIETWKRRAYCAGAAL